jgi:D-lactate dehydrogenase
MYNKHQDGIMALIYFYDATELDKQQLTAALKETDHHWEYVDDKIEPGNCNADAEVISVFVTSSVTRDIIAAMPKLRVIACRSTGFNNIDLEAAKERDITVLNVPTYGEATVAEYAFMLLLALTRKLPAVLDAEEKRFAPQELNGHDLQGKVFGVIGTGHIGQKTLKIANGFSMKTLGFDVNPDKELEAEFHFSYVELDELLKQSDVVSLHVPYLPATHHLMNHERLSKMKPGAILVNTARGELVDTRALIESLDKGHLGGAAIDVVEGEALLNYQEETALLRSDALAEDVLRHSVEISVLKKMPNVIISPHNAYNTVEAIERINNTTAKNIIDYWYGQVPNKVVPPKQPMGKLLLVRHAESEWNAVGKWTGLTDIDLSDKGFKEAAKFGQALKKLGIRIDAAYCSEQIRTRETIESMLAAAQQFHVDVVPSHAMNERDYGDYTGRNKWEMEKLIGEDAFNAVRRGWNVPVPNGETLKMVYERVVPFYEEVVVPQLIAGKNVLIVAHGNSIRALMKYIDSISDEDISNLEMLFGQIIIYDISNEGHGTSSSVVKIDTKPPHA